MSTVAKIEAQIAKLTVKLAEAKLAEANTISLDKLADGTQITFKFGKGDDAKVLSGRVLGSVKPEGKGAVTLRVLTGEGVNTRVVGIFVSQVQSIVTDEAAAE